jgi:2-isopropylmalate synthase
MREIEIFDTTLRDGEQAPDNTMNCQQKVEIALALEDLGVDIIEAGFPANKNHDYKPIREISKEIKDVSICALARCNKRDINISQESLSEAKNPMINVLYPTSLIHLKAKFGQTEEQSLAVINEHIRYARNLFPNVIFAAEDATRSGLDHLIRAFEVAAESGAGTLEIADTTGYAQPSEMADIVRAMKTKFPDVKIGIHCHNDLGLATANSLAGIYAGANHVQVTVNGIGERSGNAALEEVVMNLKVREKCYGCRTNIDYSKIYTTSRLVYANLGRNPSHEKALVGVNSFRHEAGIHVSGMLKNIGTYESIDPSTMGRKSEIVRGMHSGKEEKFEK